VRTRLGQSETFVREASVKAVMESEVGDGKYTDFRVTFKIVDSAEGEGVGTAASRESTFEGYVTDALSDILVPDGVTLSLDGHSGAVHLSVVFSEEHPVDDIRAKLEQEAALQSVRITPVPESLGSYSVSADTSPGRDATELITAIRRAFRGGQDSAGDTYRLATPIPSSSSVGPQVVGELRDKALLALAFSLFVVVLYIRVRFAEYSYGFAAVAALLHDVLITLGVLTLLNYMDVLNGEISLPMIAAFLTIIGYSLNDTIVIFDRVRENLPRMKVPLRDVLNESINQTLSRTILTSITTFVAVGTLYAFNFGTGNVLESFSFAMMVGIITGTYSTIFIANPTLLWLEHHFSKKRSSTGEKSDRQVLKSEASA